MFSNNTLIVLRRKGVGWGGGGGSLLALQQSIFLNFKIHVRVMFSNKPCCNNREIIPRNRICVNKEVLIPKILRRTVDDNFLRFCFNGKSKILKYVVMHINEEVAETKLSLNEGLVGMLLDTGVD